jgi:hypothetical protein
MDERSENFSLQAFPSHLQLIVLACRKVLGYGASGFSSHPKEDVLRIFIALENPSPWAGFERANLGSSGKHTKHYTTETTSFFLIIF